MREVQFKKIRNLPIFIAEKTKDRMIGLMFKKNINHGLLIMKCNSIQTFFMKEAIDVIFLSKKNEVIDMIQEIKPWRITRLYFKATKVLELPAKTLKTIQISKGDHLEYEVL